MAEWHVPNMWQGGECFIIAGGPSMPRQFGIPEEVIQNVMNRKELPSAYSPYLKPIHNKHVIAVNNAYQIGSWINVVFFGDCAWYLLHRLSLSKFPGLKVTSCKRFLKKPSKKADGIKYLTRDTSHRLGISNNPKQISWNSNSGAAAINLAVHFGAKRITLLGFDMNLDGNKVSHWHGSHKKLGEKVIIPPFKRHLKGFPVIAEDAKQLGVEILLVGSDSAIEVFPKVLLADVI